MNASGQFLAPGGRATRVSASPANAKSRLRIVLLASEPVVVERVRLALDNPRIQLRVARDQSESTAVPESWHPTLVIVDMGTDAGQTLAQLAVASWSPP